MTETKFSLTLVSGEHHLVLNSLAGKKTIAKSNPIVKINKQKLINKESTNKNPFFFVDDTFYKTDHHAGIHTKKRTIKAVDVSVEAGVSLANLFEVFPGVWSKKWLSQSQIMKIYKHFNNWLSVDDTPNLFLCKKNEFVDVNEEHPWRNLQIVELKVDHENDVSIRIISYSVIRSKRITKDSFRVIIPVRCGQ